MKRIPSKIKRRVLTAVLIAGVVLLGIGPWPAWNRGYEGSRYQTRTLKRLPESIRRQTPPAPLFIGTAETDISPAAGHYLAGFTNRDQPRCRSIRSRCYARALTVRSGDRTVTILTADLLLITRDLAEALVRRTGLAAGELFLCASHTHGGPGGYARRMVEQIAFGPYDGDYFNELAALLTDTVLRSRADLTRAEMATISTNPGSVQQQNRIHPALPVHEPLDMLVFRPLEAVPSPASATSSRRLVVLAAYGAHATVTGHQYPVLTADYPGYFANHLKRITGAGMVLFAAGAVGDSSLLIRGADSRIEAAQSLGKSLAEAAAAPIAAARFQKQCRLESIRLEVALPQPRFHLSAHWRLSPLITFWLSDATTHLSLLRIGPAVMIGFPGDYTGHLANRLADFGRSRGLSVIATSFNGDYKGYFVSREVFQRHGCYETRLMSFYGGNAGDYLNDLALRVLEKLAP